MVIVDLFLRDIVGLRVQRREFGIERIDPRARRNARRILVAQGFIKTRRFLIGQFCLRVPDGDVPTHDSPPPIARAHFHASAPSAFPSRDPASTPSLATAATDWPRRCCLSPTIAASRPAASERRKALTHSADRT